VAIEVARDCRGTYDYGGAAHFPAVTAHIGSSSRHHRPGVYDACVFGSIELDRQDMVALASLALGSSDLEAGVHLGSPEDTGKWDEASRIITAAVQLDSGTPLLLIVHPDAPDIGVKVRAPSDVSSPRPIYELVEALGCASTAVKRIRKAGETPSSALPGS